ncbi:MAG: glycosyl hydrolase family 65 protein, partial [bacterium]
FAHDYGYTFLNLNAIWYGIASDQHKKEIMEWLEGKRIIEGDTSVGKDIYRWRFGPRASTKRNIDWYIFPWWNPEAIPFGYQVQDGGGVLGFTFYDLWARLKILGPDNAWQRLSEILEWEKEVWKEGGYREYYKDGKRGTTLQGGGTAGGIGIDYEFYESSLLPSIVVYGFLGINPRGDCLEIIPSLPKACPEMGINNLLYRGVKMDVKASDEKITIHLQEKPIEALKILLEGEWRLSPSDQQGRIFALKEPGIYTFVKLPRR